MVDGAGGRNRGNHEQVRPSGRSPGRTVLGRLQRRKSFSHAEGRLNPADVGTRPGVKLSDLGPGSRWQGGPEFLKLPRSQWPLKKKVSAKVPEEEVRKRPLELRGVAAAMKGRAEEGTKDGRRPLSLYSILSLLGMARKALETASSWSKAQGTLARVLRASSKGEKAQVKEDPGQRERQPRSYSSWFRQNLHRKPWRQEHY